MASINRTDLLEYAAEYLGAHPHYLFRREPEYAVLRHDHDGPWFAVLMAVEGSKVGLPDANIVDIAVVKNSPDAVRMFVGNPGFVPAYHMNKTHWMGLVLESQDREEILDALHTSFDLTRPRR